MKFYLLVKILFLVVTVNSAPIDDNSNADKMDLEQHILTPIHAIPRAIVRPYFIRRVQLPDVFVSDASFPKNGPSGHTTEVPFSTTEVNGFLDEPPVTAKHEQKLRSQGVRPVLLPINVRSKTADPQFRPKFDYPPLPAMRPFLKTTSKPVLSTIDDKPTSKKEPITISQTRPQIYPTSYPEPQLLILPPVSKSKIRPNAGKETHQPSGPIIFRIRSTPSHEAQIVKLVSTTQKFVHESVTTPKPVVKPFTPNPVPEPIETPKQKFKPSITKIVPRSELVPNKQHDTVGNNTFCAEDGYHSIPDENTSYIQCKDSHALKVLCPHGEIFNKSAKYPAYACQYPSQVESQIEDLSRFIKEKWPEAYKVLMADKNKL